MTSAKRSRHAIPLTARTPPRPSVQLGALGYVGSLWWRLLHNTDFLAVSCRSSIRGSIIAPRISSWRSIGPVPRSATRRRSGWAKAQEFIPRDLSLWAYPNQVALDFSRPGKPTDNAFNGRFGAECLNAHWLLTLADARGRLEAWFSYYNEQRPNGAIGNKVPISQHNSGDAPSPSS